MTTITKSGHRPIRLIAEEIKQVWSKIGKGVYFGAVPYLEAMETLDDITDDYYFDSGTEMVIYFLANANTWRGETARRVKAELKKLAGLK